MPPSLSATGLRLLRGGRTVIDGLSLEAGPGETIGLLGPNGAGKSTLLDAFSGVLDPAAGQLTLNGRPMGQTPPEDRARQIAFVPQKESPLFGYTLRELCAMGRLAWNRGWRETPEDARAVAQALETTGLTALAEKSVLEVSGGELQLGLIARALAQEAPILLLDEPTASLDLARHSALSLLLRRHGSQGGCAVIATHDINWALALCTRVVCLSGGRAAYDGPPADSRAALEECFGVRLLWIADGDRPQALVDLSGA